MKHSKKIETTIECDIPTGVFLKRKHVNDFYFIVDDKTVLHIDVPRVLLMERSELHSHDSLDQYQQITRKEFQSEFSKLFSEIQKFHSFIQAAPEMTDQSVFAVLQGPLAADHAHLVTNQTEKQS